MARSARAHRRGSAALALFTALFALLILEARPALAHDTVAFTDAARDANGVNDQIYGTCCDASAPVGSQASGDITKVSLSTVYRDTKPVATRLRMTLTGRVSRDYGYELRAISSRCGSLYGFFTATGGVIRSDCSPHDARVYNDDVPARAAGRTLVVTLPYDLDPSRRLLSRGDRLRYLQMASNSGMDVVAVPRFDWANAATGLTFTVGR